jgi:hypothetical protein
VNGRQDQEKGHFVMIRVYEYGSLFIAHFSQLRLHTVLGDEMLTMDPLLPLLATFREDLLVYG